MNNIRKLAKLISNLALTNAKMPAVVKYEPQKTKTSSAELRYFKRETPERHGISSARIYKMLSALEAEPEANVHTIMILKDGAVVSECHAPGYDINTAHLTHSMSKTVTGLAIGMLADEGKLDIRSRLVDIFPEYKPKDRRFKRITVEHLLKMTSGVFLNELAVVTDEKWTESFFASRLTAEPGSTFKYNSMNSYMLAKIVSKISGVGLCEFLKERFFAPLGIENYFWELGPEGIEKGGWGLYLSTESWAKITQLLLDGGSFEGRKIVSRKWIKLSTSTHAEASDILGDFNYGYHLWVAKDSDEFMLSGMLGQIAWVCPHNNLLVVVLSGNNEFFQQSATLNIIRRYLSTSRLDAPHDKSSVKLLREKEKRFFETRRAVIPLEKKRGLPYALGLISSKPYDHSYDTFLGHYGFPSNNNGILPMFVRAMQNNYMGGIESFRIEKFGNNIRLTSREGGIDYSFTAGIYDYKTSTVDFKGEKYIISAACEITHNYEESNAPVLKISMIFPELPNSTLISVTPISQDRISVKISETPNQKMVFPFIETQVADNPLFEFITTAVQKRFGRDFLETRLKDTFEPRFVAVRYESANYEEMIAEMNLDEEERIASMRILVNLIARFTKNLDE